MTTEAEASKKWCPFGRIGHRAGIAINDPMNPNFSAHCIGSGCMAWRWNGYMPVAGSPIEGQDEASGYCGLAGRLE